MCRGTTPGAEHDRWCALSRGYWSKLEAAGCKYVLLGTYAYEGHRVVCPGDATPAPTVDAETTYQALKQVWSACVAKEIKTGAYTSYDKGWSMLKILNKCDPDDAFRKACVATGDTWHDCSMTQGLSVQIMLKVCEENVCR